MTITEFLLARIAEDEAVARDWRHLALTGHDKVSIYGGGEGYVQLVNPTRVLGECAAKRAIITMSVQATCESYVNAAAYLADALQVLAAVYADHSEYDPEWKP